MSLPPTYVKDFHDENYVKKMEYMTFGKTGLRISKVSLGGGVYSQFYGDVDETTAIKSIHTALKMGVNYIDTAPWYGQGKSEEIIGRALKDVPRSAYYIGTKIGRYELDVEKMFDFSAEKTRQSIEKSLNHLGLDYVDVVQIHDIEFASNIEDVINETLPALEEIVKEGKARFIGVTGYPLDVLSKAISLTPGRFDTVLSYCRYTMFDESLKEFIPFFEKNNLGIVCASGIGMGLLSNDGPQPWHPAHQELKAICQKAAQYCKDNNVELGRLAMSHFIQLKGATTFLVGMQTPAVVLMNLSLYFDGLTEKETEVLQYLNEKLVNNFCIITVESASSYFTSGVIENRIFTKKTYNWEGVEIEKMQTKTIKY